MNSDQAIKIMESKGVIEVSHMGDPVWLEGIHGELAEVTYLKTNQRKEVPLEQLT